MTGYRRPDVTATGQSSAKDETSPKKKKDLSAYDRWEVPAIADDGVKLENQIVTGTGFRINGVKPPTVHDLEEIRRVAYEEGFKEGKDKGFLAGYKLGIEKGEEEKKAESVLTAQVARALLEPIDKQDQGLEKVMLSMVIRITKLILKRELKIDSSQIMQIVREALTALNCGRKKIKILLHPTDLANIFPEIKSLPEYDESWSIVEHSGLSPGGCIVESNEGLVDASVDSRVEQMVVQIYEEKVLTPAEIQSEPSTSSLKSAFLDEDEAITDEPNSDKANLSEPERDEP